jgi:hypothetical protein
MADAKISALTNLTAADPTNDMIPIVDVSDTPPASGNTKRISINNILSSSPTASGALTVTGLVTAGSASITGAATVGTTLGVTGVSTFAAGTALLPALTTTGDTNTGIYYPASDTFAVTTGGTERYRVDSAGNCGIGVTPSAWASTWKAIQVGATGSLSYSPDDTGYTISTSNGYWNGSDWIRIAAAAVSAYSQNQGKHTWLSAASSSAGSTIAFGDAKMTLDASGNLLVGTTSALAAWATRLTLSTNAGTTKWAVGPYAAATNFIISADGGYGVYLNGTTATSWTGISDERLKDIIEPISNAVTKVGQLRSVIGKFKSDETNTRRSFLIAQDVQAVLPEAVDASNPDRLGVAYTEVIPLLVAAIKELTARVQTLEAR